MLFRFPPRSRYPATAVHATITKPIWNLRIALLIWDNETWYGRSRDTTRGSLQSGMLFPSSSASPSRDQWTFRQSETSLLVRHLQTVTYIITSSPDFISNILSRVWVTIDGVLDWILDLLTTLTCNSWLHLIIAPSLISTLYSSLEHTLSLFQPAVSSLVVAW
jgi:hypothetical protein